MRRVVIDSSVSVKWLSDEGEQRIHEADLLLNEVQKGKTELYAPELSKYEIGNVLWKKKFSAQKGKSTLVTFYSLPITFVTETRERAVSTLELSKQLGITYYDAAFISLAEELDGILITDNPKHQAKAKHIRVLPLASIG